MMSRSTSSISSAELAFFSPPLAGGVCARVTARKVNNRTVVMGMDQRKDMARYLKQIRISKSEIRNKPEIRSRKSEPRLSAFSCLGFGFVSDFEFRYSDFC